MIKFSVLTLFPELFKEFSKSSIIGMAVKTKKIEIELINFRDFSTDKHKKVDDYQCGGGPGMVLTLQPIVSALESIQTKNSKTILLSPEGKVFNQNLSRKLISSDHIILICGHYEGFDKRIENYVDEIISLGDFVLTGGEIPAMAIIDSISRQLEGVISANSLISESFNAHLLDHDAYTKPVDFRGHLVPEVLMSGDHKKIEKFRQENSILKTKTNRPDLYKKYLKNKQGD